MLVNFFSPVVKTCSPELKRYPLRGGGCNIHFFPPHTYCRLPILNVIAARRPLKLDILSSLLLYNLLYYVGVLFSYKCYFIPIFNLIVQNLILVNQLKKSIELCSICTAFSHFILSFFIFISCFLKLPPNVFLVPTSRLIFNFKMAGFYVISNRGVGTKKTFGGYFRKHVSI